MPITLRCGCQTRWYSFLYRLQPRTCMQVQGAPTPPRIHSPALRPRLLLLPLLGLSLLLLLLHRGLAVRGVRLVIPPTRKVRARRTATRSAKSSSCGAAVKGRAPPHLGCLMRRPVRDGSTSWRRWSARSPCSCGKCAWCIRPWM